MKLNRKGWENNRVFSLFFMAEKEWRLRKFTKISNVFSKEVRLIASIYCIAV